MRCADHALEYRKLADIKPYQKNPRKNDKAVTAVANSIREYGFQSPIIVDRDGVIIAGPLIHIPPFSASIEKRIRK